MLYKVIVNFNHSFVVDVPEEVCNQTRGRTNPGTPIHTYVKQILFNNMENLASEYNTNFSIDLSKIDKMKLLK